MSGRKSKKNQRLGSSRRGSKGLNRNIEKDDNDGFQQIAESEDGRDEFHTTSATQFEHPPSSRIEQQTSELECPSHARGHKDSLMETDLPERKRKMGSTRKSTGRFKGDKNLDDVRTTEELDQEYKTQPNTSTTEKRHAYLTEQEQSSFPSDVSLQTKSSGFGKESGTTPMFASSENKEITSLYHEVLSDMLVDEAVGPSVHSIAVTVVEHDLLREDSVMFNDPKTIRHQETQIASTSGQKKRMGSARRPLGEQNSENVGVQEHSRNMTENERKAEVMGEAKMKMSEVMAQTWDDVARDDPSSHTESALLFSQSLLADRAELKELGVVAGTETMKQSVAFPLVDSEKPLPETSSHHGTPLLNEALDFEFGSHPEDLDVLNKVLEEAGSHNSQHVSDARKDTNPSSDFRDVNTEAKKWVLMQKEKPQLEELALHDQESSLIQHDIATLDNSHDCSMVQTIVGGSRSFDMPVSNISHAEPTMPNLPHDMRNAVEERQEIDIEMKQENNVCNVSSVTCDTLTDLVSVTEEDKDPHILAMRENENMSDERGSETEYAFKITDQCDVRDHNVTQIILDVRDNEKDVETSTETTWISHQKPCDVSTEKEDLYKGQEHYSLNISLTHSPTQDGAGKMLENEEVRKDQKETEHTAVNDVTSNSDSGSHAHQQLFMQFPDKEGYDLHENVNDKGEKEGIFLSVESENAAFDRSNERSEGTDRNKEMEAALVPTLDVGDADLHLQIEAQNQTLDSTNSKANGTEDNISGTSVLVRENKITKNTVESNMTESDFPQSSPEAHMEALKVSENFEKKVSGETNLNQSGINIVPEDSHKEETHSKSSPVVYKRKMGSTRRPLKGNKGQRTETEHHETLDSEDLINVQNEAFKLESEHRPDESTLPSLKDGAKQQMEKNYVGPFEEPESALLQSSGILDLVSEESTAISICHITESQTLTNTDVKPQENTGDAERMAAEDGKDLQLEIEAQNKTSDSTTSEAEETEKNIHDAPVLVREVEVIGDTDTVESNMTNESDLLQSSPDVHMEALNVSKNSEKEVSGETDTNLKQSDISIIPADSQREETHSKSSPVIQKRKMGSTRRPLKGNKGQRKETERHDENETLDSEDRISAISICHITELQTLTNINVEPQENTGEAERVAAEDDKNLQLEIEARNKTSDSTTSETEEIEKNIQDVNVALIREVEVIGDTVTVTSNMTTESDFIQSSPDAHMEALKVSENSEKEVSGETDTNLKQSDISIIPADSQREETHSKSNPVIQKRKIGSTRRPLKGNKGQRKGHDEKENFNLEDKHCPEESRYTALSICDISESQTLTNIHSGSQENIGDVEIVPAEGNTESHSEEKTFDSTAFEEEAEVREVLVIGDAVTVVSNMTTESDLHQTSDANMEILKVSENEQSGISIIPADSHREGTHSKSSPVIQKRKMGSTRRPLKGNTGQRKGHDEKEIFILEDEPGPEESRYTAVNICEISESQTLTNIHAGSHENIGDVEIVPAEGDTESHSEDKAFELTAFEKEATEENIRAATALDRKAEFVGDAAESNMTTESDLIESYTLTDSKPEAFISEIAKNKITEKTDTISKQSVSYIIPEDPNGDEEHTKLSLNVHKRKMGSTRRPLRGNKEQRKVRVESKENNEDSEGVSEEEDTETHSVIQNQDNLVDHNVTQEILNISDVKDDERKTMKIVDMSVQKQFADLELDQRLDASQTQTGLSQDDTGSHLLEFPESTADSNSLSDVHVFDALETQIYVSSNDVPPTEVVERNPVSKMSVQKRKIGSTRKRGKRMVNDKEVEDEKVVANENTITDDETTKSEEKLTPEEAITGSPVHQQLFSSSDDKEGHDIQDIICKSDVQAENSEQNYPKSTTTLQKLLIESQCSSNAAAEMVSDLPLGDVNTYLDPKQSVIPKESHREDQPNLNPVVQKRKMGSTRKTLRGNKGQGRIAESKKMDGNSEGMTQEQDAEPHLETRARTELDEEIEQNFPVESSHPVASSNTFLEPVKEFSQNDLSEVSEEKGIDITGNNSNNLSETINEGTKDKFVLTVSHKDIHQIVSEPEQTEITHKVIATQEKRRKMGSTRRNPRAMHGRNMADNEDVLGLAEDRETEKADNYLKEASSISQSEEVSSVSTTDPESEMLVGATDLKVENDHLHSSRPTETPETPENTLQICDNQLVNADVTKHPQSETVSTEKRRKMGSTRKNPKEGGIRGKREGYEYTETKDTNLEMLQDSEMSLVREDVRKPTTHDYSSQSEDSLLNEIERALNKTSQSPLSCDWELITKEPNPDDLANAPNLNMPENSEIRSLQPIPSTHSEPNSPGGRRRKMGSTRKNPRQQLKAEREDEDKEYGEIDENSKANKQEKKDLERVEVSVVHNITENKLNKDYLDVSSAHTSSNQLEESTNPVSQEKTSPSTKRKFGSRRANKDRQGFGRMADSDIGNELEDGDQKPDSSEVKDKLHSDDLAVCDPCLSLQPENRPASEQRNMEAKNEEATPKGTGAGLVSLDQIMKHDRSTGARQTVNLKNRISDTEVVQFNVVMVGNSCVGKTSFIRRFHEGQFTEDYRSTIGVDTCVQTVALPDKTVKLQIWDTAGQERFHSITTQVFHKADGLLFMYEITCSKSFISVRDWISQARERAPDDVIMMLLGNKSDSEKREVQIQEGADLAREYNIHFMECSAATGANVSESMMSLAEMLVQRKSQKEKHTTLRRDPPQKKSGCC